MKIRYFLPTMLFMTFLIGVIFGMVLEKATFAAMAGWALKDTQLELNINLNETKLVEEANKTFTPAFRDALRDYNATQEEVLKKEIVQTGRMNECSQPNDCFYNQSLVGCHRDYHGCNWCCGNSCNLAMCFNYSSNWENHSK